MNFFFNRFTSRTLSNVRSYRYNSSLKLARKTKFFKRRKIFSYMIYTLYQKSGNLVSMEFFKRKIWRHIDYLTFNGVYIINL